MIKITIFVLISIFALGGCSSKEEERIFRDLRNSRRKPDKAKMLAQQLMKTEAGIQMALDDFDCFGGSNRGWSSWIILQAPGKKINNYLEAIINNNKTSDSKKIEAIWLLWKRTKKEKYLEMLFNEVTPAGSKSIQTGRGYLASLTTDKTLIKKININSYLTLEIKFDTFRKSLHLGNETLKNLNKKNE